MKTKRFHNSLGPEAMFRSNLLAMKKAETNSLLGKWILAVCFFMIGGWCATAADANPPERMTYQGYIVDSNGVEIGDASPVIFEVVFRIYETPQGGNSLWSEKQTVVFNKGSFAVVLGEGAEVTPDPHESLSSIFVSETASDRYMGITVQGLGGGNVEIAPRLRLLTTPYSFLSSRASSLVNDSGALLIHSDNGNLLVGGPIQTTGGNTRGANAVDLQVARDANTNVSKGEVSVIGGGKNNRAALKAATVSGGLSNFADGENATIGGGKNNLASGLSSTVAGGQANEASVKGTSVGGGQNNKATAQYATASGGTGNLASGDYSAVGGGRQNTASNDYSASIGGYNGKATGRYSVILGGGSNEGTASYSMAGGRKAKSRHDGSFVWSDSRDREFESTGNNQFLIEAQGGVGINRNNPRSALDVEGIITAQSLDLINSSGSSIFNANELRLQLNVPIQSSGGDLKGNFAVELQTVRNNSSQVAGGTYSVISGGKANTASATFTTVAGGHNGVASGRGATIAGGEYNVASGTQSTVAGGNYNKATGNYSFAAGRYAEANNGGSFVWSDNSTTPFSSTANNQFLINAAGNVGINKNNPNTALDVEGTVTATKFAGYGTIPIGGIILWASPNQEPPEGWVRCDGGIYEGIQTPDMTLAIPTGRGTREDTFPNLGNTYTRDFGGGSKILRFTNVWYIMRVK